MGDYGGGGNRTRVRKRIIMHVYVCISPFDLAYRVSDELDTRQASPLVSRVPRGMTTH